MWRGRPTDMTKAGPFRDYAKSPKMTAFVSEYDLQFIQGLKQSINIITTASKIMATLCPAKLLTN